MVMIENTLKKLQIDKNVPIVVAVSGGPDSMALLSLLEKKFDNIICAHVNHNTGRIGQNEEEEFVKEYCKNKGHIFESMIIEKYDKGNFHNQAHHMRYKFFEMLLKKYNSSYLFTAHHGDDLMETMLFRMMRGTTLKALHGFSKITKKKDYYIVRPLLEYTKAELLNYNIKNNIPYCIDSSNEKEVYTRNRIRKNILPFIKSENKNVHLKFLALSEELEDVENYIEKEVKKEIKVRYNHNILSLKDWHTVDTLIKKRIIQTVLGMLYENQNKLESIHVNQIIDLTFKQSGVKIDLPGNYIVRKEYNTIIFENNKTEADYKIELVSNTELPNGHRIKFVTEEESDSNYVCRLNKNDIVMPLIVRTKKKQDYMEVKGLNGSKKIKEIFINSKIPVHERKLYPIVTDSTGKIVWLPGVKKSKFDKTKEEKYDIILRYY